MEVILTTEDTPRSGGHEGNDALKLTAATSVAGRGTGGCSRGAGWRQLSAGVQQARETLAYFGSLRRAQTNVKQL